MPPQGELNEKAWKLLVIFLATILGAILNPVPMGALVMMSILASLLTNTLTPIQAFSGFGSPIVWLVVFAFLISRAVIKSNLGKRIAYYLIAKFGHSLIGLSYSLIVTDLFLAPFIPSASARGGGIIYPVVQSLIDQYNFISTDKKSVTNLKIREFLMQLCFQANIITSSMFLTAMAGNPLIASLANSIGSELSITTWALGAIVPGICALIVLPFFIKFMIKPTIDHSDMMLSSILAKKILEEMGVLSKKEITVLLTFLLLVILWAAGDFLGIEATTTALVGLIILILTEVINWDDVVNEKEAWRIFIWFSGFVMLSKFLSEMGVTNLISDNMKEMLMNYNLNIAIPLLIILFFYMHYFFASITVYASVMFIAFSVILISFGIQPLAATFILAVLANLSACLTHYGSTSAPIFFSASHMNIKSWWSIGFVMSIIYLFIWSTVGIVWLRILNWL